MIPAFKPGGSIAPEFVMLLDEEDPQALVLTSGFPRQTFSTGDASDPATNDGDIASYYTSRGFR
jgi:hypothetical protein